MDVELNEAEQRAADAIIEAMEAIRALSEERNVEPANFSNEVIPAVHTLQMFVLMSWAHRIHPGYWSDWFWKDGSPPWIPNPSDLEAAQSAMKVPPR